MVERCQEGIGGNCQEYGDIPGESAQPRFGIGLDREYPLEEAGQEFDVSRERIRQIEVEVSRSLKHFSRGRKLQSFIGR